MSGFVFLPPPAAVLPRSSVPRPAQTARRARPFLLLLSSTFLPSLVARRDRKPCVRFRLTTLGWYVLLISCMPPASVTASVAGGTARSVDITAQHNKPPSTPHSLPHPMPSSPLTQIVEGGGAEAVEEDEILGRRLQQVLHRLLHVKDRDVCPSTPHTHLQHISTSPPHDCSPALLSARTLTEERPADRGLHLLLALLLSTVVGPETCGHDTTTITVRTGCCCGRPTRLGSRDLLCAAPSLPRGPDNQLEKHAPVINNIKPPSG